MSGQRQKIQPEQLGLALWAEGRSEAPSAALQGTEPLTAKRSDESPVDTERLMEEVCGRDNCRQTLKRVKAKKGTPGVDGMTVQELPGHLERHWPAIREQLLNGRYHPQPVKRVEIDKPDGGVRKLGVPDRAGSICPASGAAGPADALGPDVFRSQLRVPTRALGASGGGTGSIICIRELPLGGGSGPGAVL
jgi:hypothetical protein